MTEITLPQIDENVVEYTIGKWLKTVGEPVAENEPILEVETDKVTMEVVAESAGVIAQILVNEGDVLRPGAVLCHLDIDGSAVAKLEMGNTQRTTNNGQRNGTQLPMKTVLAEPERELRLSPVVSRMVAEHALDVTLIDGTGRNGRITKKDVVAFLNIEKSREKRVKRGIEYDQPLTSDIQQSNKNESKTEPIANPQSEIVDLTPMRRSIAEHMVRSLATSPHVTTVFEFDFQRVASHRAKHKANYAADGIKLTYMAYIAHATAEALKKFPLVNSQFHDDQIELKRDINVGMIVAVPDGLYAPVIHHADEYNLKGLARAIGDVASKAHSGQLKPADMQDGTFTISNHGAAGSIAGTPIIFQPQAGILGVGAIEERVKVIDGGMHIRPCTYISFSFDHRVMDGAVADGFCSEIKRIIESWPE
ncbi:MAG: dihydrolipoamide acetyltransferase family protein [Chloroflexota bacterium]